MRTLFKVLIIISSFTAIVSSYAASGFLSSCNELTTSIGNHQLVWTYWEPGPQCQTTVGSCTVSLAQWDIRTRTPPYAVQMAKGGIGVFDETLPLRQAINLINTPNSDFQKAFLQQCVKAK